MQAQLTELQEGITALEAKTDPEMELYGSEARNLLKSENVTNEMLLFFISRVKVCPDGSGRSAGRPARHRH